MTSPISQPRTPTFRPPSSPATCHLPSSGRFLPIALGRLARTASSPNTFTVPDPQFSGASSSCHLTPATLGAISPTALGRLARTASSPNTFTAPDPQFLGASSSCHLTPATAENATRFILGIERFRTSSLAMAAASACNHDRPLAHCGDCSQDCNTCRRNLPGTAFRYYKNKDPGYCRRKCKQCENGKTGEEGERRPFGAV